MLVTIVAMAICIRAAGWRQGAHVTIAFLCRCKGCQQQLQPGGAEVPRRRLQDRHPGLTVGTSLGNNRRPSLLPPCCQPCPESPSRHSGNDCTAHCFWAAFCAEMSTLCMRHGATKWAPGDVPNCFWHRQSVLFFQLARLVQSLPPDCTSLARMLSAAGTALMGCGQ